MPHICNDWDHVDENRFLSEQLAYNTTNELTLANKSYSHLNAEQQSAYQSVLEAVQAQSGQTFFLNSPARTGKTFVYQVLCHHVVKCTVFMCTHPCLCTRAHVLSCLLRLS